jgi:hypothetical protein
MLTVLNYVMRDELQIITNYPNRNDQKLTNKSIQNCDDCDDD